MVVGICSICCCSGEKRKKKDREIFAEERKNLFSFQSVGFSVSWVRCRPPAPGLGGRMASESLGGLLPVFNFWTRAGMCRGPYRRRMGVGFKIGVGGYTSFPPCILKPRFGGA